MASEREIKLWYDQRHLSLGEKAWRPFEAYSVFLDYLNVKAGKKLLDIGCGTGHLLSAATQRGLQTWGVDISDEGVKIAQKVSPYSKIFVGRGEELRFSDGSFDYVTCLGALEHFSDIGKGIREMVRVGKADGLFCVVVPNIDYLFWKISRTKGTEQQDINENLLPLKIWKNLFIQERLEILKIYQDRWFLKKTNIFSSINPVEIMGRAIFKLVWIFLPLHYTYQFVFIFMKSGVESKDLP